MPDLIESLVDQRRRSAVILDFDGSIAPIVDDPAAAVADPAVIEALAALVDEFAVVAVVSGRPVTFLADRLEVPGLVLAGQYGLESAVDGVQTVDPRVELFVDAVQAAAAALERESEGLTVERKGVVAVALHWRIAPEREAQAIALAHRVATDCGLEVLLGRRVAELRPAIPVDKGTVVATLVAGLDGACFAGDDEADLAAFAALTHHYERGELDLAIKIAVRSTEAPAPLLAAADMTVDGPSGLARFLDGIRARVVRPEAEPRSTATDRGSGPRSGDVRRDPPGLGPTR